MRRRASCRRKRFRPEASWCLLNYYEHHLGDYIRDAGHLSMLEEGAYRRLMDAYYIREAALPGEIGECCRLIRAQSRAEREAVAIVLREFFVGSESGWRHERCEREIARYLEKRLNAKSSANARWHPDAMRSHVVGNAHQTPDSNHHLPFKGAPSRKESEGNGTRLKEDWQLSPENREFASSLGFEAAEIDFQAAKFKDFWRGRAGRDALKSDWDSTWRNWARNAFERRAIGNGQKPVLPDMNAPKIFSFHRGEAEHAAWLAHYVRIGRHRDPAAQFLDRLSVPEQWPPSPHEGGENVFHGEQDVHRPPLGGAA